MEITVYGQTYNFASAPKFVQHAIRLIAERWGTNLANAQGFVQHKAADLGQRFGTLG